MIKLILFGTGGCHLCEQAEELIGSYQLNEPDLWVEKIDIAEQDQWQEKYAVRIPVLFDQQTSKELGWPFNQTDLDNFVSAIKFSHP